MMSGIAKTVCLALIVLGLVHCSMGAYWFYLDKDHLLFNILGPTVPVVVFGLGLIETAIGLWLLRTKSLP